MSAPSQHVALKIHRRRYHHDGKREFFVARLIVEQGLPLESISLPLEGFQTPEGRVCLAYPLLGRDLAHWIQDRGRPFSIEETRMIARKTLVFLEAFHRTGVAHTDIKPDNFLYDPVTEQFRLIDFGNAERRFNRGTPIATREYTPPEGIIGGTLSPAVDLWSLGCTLFELLTGKLLFDPHEAAARKYIEFSEDGDEVGDEAPDTPTEDELAEEDAAFRPGFLVEEKYRLIREIGNGNFARVWQAEVLHPDRSLKPLEIQAASPAAQAGAEGSDSGVPDRARESRRNNLKRFGVSDTYDLALNYEHLLLIQNLLGPCPAGIAMEGLFQRIYFDPVGSLKFDPPPIPFEVEDSIFSRLILAGIGENEARSIESLLLDMLQYDPDARATAGRCLEHPWLGSKG